MKLLIPAGIQVKSWWSHQIEKFSALLALCEGNSAVTGGFSSRSPVTRSFNVFYDVRLNKQLSKHSRCRWFETPWHSLWRRCNPMIIKRAIGAPKNNIFCATFFQHVSTFKHHSTSLNVSNFLFSRVWHRLDCKSPPQSSLIREIPHYRYSSCWLNELLMKTFNLQYNLYNSQFNIFCVMFFNGCCAIAILVSLQWRHTSVIASQKSGNPTTCSTSWAS